MIFLMLQWKFWKTSSRNMQHKGRKAEEIAAFPDPHVNTLQRDYTKKGGKMQISDNPVRDAMRYDMEQAEKDRQCLHCAICGAAILYGDDYFDIDDVIYCEDCLADQFRKVANYD